MNLQLATYTIRPFVVVVPELPEKTVFIDQHLHDAGIEAEHFNGLYAVESGLVTTHCYEDDNPGGKWNIGARPVATWVAFWGLWTAMSYMPESHFLTLEWDVKLKPDWRERTQLALQFAPPDFDVILLGSCCTEGKPAKPLGGDLYEVKYPMCGHATIWAKKALPIMLATQRKVYAPVDISVMKHSYPLLKVFTVLPRVADQFQKQIPV